MEMRQLWYFVAVGEEEHYGRAGQRLCVAQPALSRQIQSMEEEIGFKLFERLPRGVKITAAGKLFLDDARRILQGQSTAATEYFKEKTTDKLTSAFGPVVSSAMNEVGVTRQYKQLVGAAQSLPFMSVEAFDLDHYVVGKALDGLFHVVGEEEQKIRANPTARTTPLLKEVFAR